MQISLQNVEKSFGSDLIFRDVTAKIEDADRIGLVGINGAGKTTLLKIICGELMPDAGEIARGVDLTIGYQKQNCGLSQQGTIWSEMRSVFADVYRLEEELHSLREKMAVTADVAVTERYKQLEDAFLARDGYQVEVKINTVLTGMGFAEQGFEQRIDKLSGGEQTRLAIAKLLLERPSLLVLDEPTNHLDFKTLTWLEDYLATYKGALLIVSHDRYFLDRLCNKIWEMEDGELREYKGNYTAYCRQREEQDSRQRKLVLAQQQEIAKLEDYVARNLVRASTTKMAQSRRKQLEKLEPVEKPHRRLKPPAIRLEYEGEPVKDVLLVENLSLEVGEGENRRSLASSVSFEIHRGDKVAIIGANGAGKTTLLKALIGPTCQRGGRVDWGRGVKRSYFDQGSDNLDQSLTVLDTMWAAYPHLYETVLRTTLGAMGLTGEDAFLRVSQLSGGERARLKLAMICLAGSNTLVLDEPTNHLDLASKEVLQKALSEYTGTLIIVSHDRYLLDRVPNRIFSLQNGELHQYAGGYSDFLRLSAAEKLEEPKNDEKKEASEQSKQYNRGKEQRRADAKRRRDYAEVEQRIADLDTESKLVKEQMNLPEVQNDYQKLQELCVRTEELQKEMDEAMERWVQLCEELGLSE